MGLVAGVSGHTDAPSLPLQGGNRPNVLLVTIDTLRADRVGAYGYAAGRTPTLDRLASEGVRFADATAHAALTLPSHVAILTGRYPGAFGVRLNGMGTVPAGSRSIAERFRREGYETAAIVGSAVLDDAYGLSHGFTEYDDRIQVPVRNTLSTAETQRRADEVTSRARSWIAGRQAPWLLWVHYYDPHLPYDPPAKYAALAPGRAYDGEIAFVDAELGALLSSIDRRRTVIAVTSDHGESLGEHGEPDHGFFLYDATLHVPLIVAAPALTTRVVAEQVRSIDIAATLSDLAGLPARADDADDGESLLPLMTGGTRRDVPVSVAESWYPRLHFGWSEIRAIRVGEWKYVAAPKPELYDLRVDRQETKNVVRDRGAVAGRLAADLSRIASRFDKVQLTPAQPDAATVERLQALGYLGAFAPVAAGTAGEDPKDHIAGYREYRTAFNHALGLLTKGNGAQAATILQGLVKLNVRAFEAHLYLGTAYALQSKLDEALGEFDVASQLNPELASPHFEAAKVLSSKGQHAQAVERCNTGLKLGGRSAYGYYTLGVVHQRAGEWPEAASAFARSVELNGVDPRARANLASASMRLGDLARARTEFEHMIQLGYQIAPAQFNLGIIAARRGDRAEAARRYKLALDADPAFKPARDALAALK
jgi:arylsulfatase A-like enzyme/Tfp pilus assembly protein PilF